jgi:hypothetical protein
MKVAESDEEEPMDRLDIAPKSQETKSADAQPSSCCSSSELSTCCEPSAKGGCCGPQADNAEDAPVSCGCR